MLVNAQTLQAPTDSQLRSARRQLGEPSDSRAPADGAAGEPASVARSRPAPMQALEEEEGEAEEAAGGEASEGAEQGEEEQEEEEEGAGAAGARLPSARALDAMAKQLAKLVSSFVEGAACGACLWSRCLWGRCLRGRRFATAGPPMQAARPACCLIRSPACLT